MLGFLVGTENKCRLYPNDMKATYRGIYPNRVQLMPENELSFEQEIEDFFQKILEIYYTQDVFDDTFSEMQVRGIIKSSYSFGLFYAAIKEVNKEHPYIFNPQEYPSMGELDDIIYEEWCEIKNNMDKKL